ncbi:MAG: nucleoside-diphosphate kinase [Elusimicrobiales bacterium]|nr:nucleoside-diphosphate kinase [Elusimicrobiales bacterium]
MAKEKTLILIKPDAAVRKLTGLIIDRLENSGFEMVAAKLVKVTDDLARKHYDSLKNQPFFENLIRYIKGELHGIKNNKILALVYSGENVIYEIRKLVGSTNPEEAHPETIRGSFGRITTKGQFENVIHASANKDDAEREIKLWFKDDEIIE